MFDLGMFLTLYVVSRIKVLLLAYPLFSIFFMGLVGYRAWHVFSHTRYTPPTFLQSDRAHKVFRVLCYFETLMTLWVVIYFLFVLLFGFFPCHWHLRGCPLVVGWISWLLDSLLLTVTLGLFAARSLTCKMTAYFFPPGHIAHQGS